MSEEIITAEQFLNEKCKECKNEEEDVSVDGLCHYCWEMKHYPETLTISEQDAKDWDECAKYIQKHNISPNLDSIY